MPNHQSKKENGAEANQHDWRGQEAKRSFVNRVLFVHHRLSLNSIPSGKSGPTGMNCSSMRFSFERGRLSMRAQASAASLQFSMKMTPLPSPRVNPLVLDVAFRSQLLEPGHPLLHCLLRPFGRPASFAATVEKYKSVHLLPSLMILGS